MEIKFLTSFKNILLGLSWKEKIFIFTVFAVDLFIQADYSLVRPVSYGLFISAYGSACLPYAWLAVLPLNFLLVALYNRLLSRYNCFTIFTLTVGLVIVVNVSFSFFLTSWKPLTFLFFIWKEIYVMLFFQQMWAMVHSTLRVEQARYLYGFIYGAGSIGGILGSLIPSFFAVKMGSEALLLFSAPIGILLLVFYSIAIRHSKLDASQPVAAPSSGLREGVKQITGSKYIFYILLMVLCMQTAVTLVDYQFNLGLELYVTQKDLRTEYWGRVMAIVNTLTFIMQFGGSMVILGLLGTRKTHYFIPLLFACNTCLAACFPVFGMLVLSYTAMKCFDFSLFGLIKEMLWIPLKKEEKFQAKSIIDIFAYRTSKAFAAGFIFFIQWLFPHSPLTPLPWLLLSLFALWLLATYFLYRPADQQVPEPQADSIAASKDA